MDKTNWHKRPTKYRKVISPDATKIFYIPIEGEPNAADHFKWVVNPADGVHYNDTQHDSIHGFKGYGGATLEFPLEDGTVDKVKGPWHTHSEALYRHTGMQISDLHYSTVKIGTERGERFMDVGGTILYEETQPVLGPFMRGDRIAQQLADVLNMTLYVVRQSANGGSCHEVTPGGTLHPMARRDND